MFHVHEKVSILNKTNVKPQESGNVPLELRVGHIKQERYPMNQMKSEKGKMEPFEKSRTTCHEIPHSYG